MVQKGTELDDVYSLVPDKLEKNIRNLQEEIVKNIQDSSHNFDETDQNIMYDIKD